METERAFMRGLSARFMHDLRDGMLLPLLRAALQHGLDLQIRDDYINLYYHGLSAIKVMRASHNGSYSATIHVKYLVGTALPCELRRNDSYALFDVGAAFLDAYVRQLAVLITNADSYRTAERDAEQVLVQNSLMPNSPVAILDRQVQVHGIRKRADVIGITRDSEPRMILGEVKVGLNNDIQYLPEQLHPYYDVLVGEDGRLKEIMACAYRNVVVQKQQLGVLPPHVAFPSGSPRVECLVILCDYNGRSRLLDRARDQAKNCGLPIWLVKPAGPDYRVPDRANWERVTS